MNALKCLMLSIALLVATKNTAQNISRALDSVLNKTLDSMVTVLNVKSLSAAIQVSDTTAWAGAKGISSLNPRVNVTVNDVYLIGSVTKTITSACILQLADEGVLRLDDSVSRWLDTIPNVNPNITIRQLLRHQSGLYDFLNHPNLQLRFLSYQDSVWTPENLLRVFLREPIASAGSAWSYCNTNYLLLGMIIKKATGKYYYEVYKQRFFTPLGFKTFAIPSYEPINSPIAHVWLDITGDGITDDAHDFYMNYKALNSAAGPEGGYFATAKETSKWMRKYMRGDLLSANMLAQARETVPAPGLPGGTYGLGLMKKTFNNILGYGHGGDLAYSASSWYFPTKDIAITVLCNDAKNNSWTLVPVIEALQKTYMDWRLYTGLDNAIDKSKIDISIYPNPFMDRIKIQTTGIPKNASISVELYNQLGQKVAHISKHQILEKETIEINNLTDLPKGLYILTVLADEKIVKTRKVVK
jgi:CubicO group peptidase (beta-lactamase class C family)